MLLENLNFRFSKIALMDFWFPHCLEFSGNRSYRDNMLPSLQSLRLDVLDYLCSINDKFEQNLYLFTLNYWRALVLFWIVFIGQYSIIFQNPKLRSFHTLQKPISHCFVINKFASHQIKSYGIIGIDINVHFSVYALFEFQVPSTLLYYYIQKVLRHKVPEKCLTLTKNIDDCLLMNSSMKRFFCQNTFLKNFYKQYL